LGGDFHEVQAMVSNLYWKLDIEDNVFAIFRNKENGIVAQLHSTMTQWRHLFSLEVFLEKGYLVLNGLKTSSGTYGDEVLSIAKNRTTAPAATWEDEERITYHTDTSWRSEIHHFFNAILNDTHIEIGNSTDALKIMKIIDKVYQKG
jgi:predicted dehydrogenase